MRIFNNLYAGAVLLTTPQQTVTKEELLKLEAQTDTSLTWDAVATAVCDTATEPVNGLKGNKFLFTNGQTYAIVRNTGAAPGTVTFHTQKTVADAAGADKAVDDEIVTVANGEEELIGPFTSTMYGATGALTTAYCSWVETTPGDLEVALVYGI